MQSRWDAAFFLSLTIYLILTGPVYQANAQKMLEPPKDVSLPRWNIGRTVTQNTALVRWTPSRGAEKYIATIFEVQDDNILTEEKKNINYTTYEFKNLKANTSYQVYVHAVRVETDGSITVSAPSAPLSILTLEACKGGMIHDECSAHCIATCEDQRPVCSRECRSGCACPRATKPFLHEGVCITKNECKAVGAPIIEVLRRPRNLRVHTLQDSTDVVFTWDEVEGADMYTVLVLLSEDESLVQSIDTEIGFVVVKNLEVGVRYKFRVQAKWQPPVARSLVLVPPKPPTVSEIKDTSFLVKWDKAENAESYTVMVYNAGSKIATGFFNGLKENYVTIQGLMPSTAYEVSVVIVRSGDLTAESFRRPAKTLDATVENGYVTEEEFVVSMPTPSPPEITEPTRPPPPYIPTCSEVRGAEEAFAKSNPDLNMEMVQCDNGGNYRATQCRDGRCFCVEKKTGKEKSGSSFEDRSSRFALNCNEYGSFKIYPISPTVTTLSTTTIDVDWNGVSGAASYIIKIYHAFTGDFVTYKSGILETKAQITGLRPGLAYIVIVVAVSRDGRTSTDNVMGQYVEMPFLDPPTQLVVQQIEGERFKVSWVQSLGAKYHVVEVFENDVYRPSMVFENVTDNFVIFPVKSGVRYTILVRASTVATVQGSGLEKTVNSNTAKAEKTPRCVLPLLDVILALDVSRKMTPGEYAKAKTFYTKLAAELSPIGKSKNSDTGTRVAAVKAYELTKTVFRFERFSSAGNLIGGLNFVKQTKSEVLNVGKMLNHVYNNFFAPFSKKDRREKAIPVVITFIGGKSDDSVSTAAAKLARSTPVIAVGVEGKDQDLSRVASSADNKIVLRDYDKVDEAYNRVMSLLCDLKQEI